ncbi:MAG: aminoacetone oxidase family FAD-binding enzyme, partial [Lentimicrobiaceae bacterium]|nr:aminoacetone oxidase family FAD-binding enzyme [Lentimicrobiaceae bacterium]
ISLCPVIPVAYPFASLSGISLSRVHLNLYRAGKWIRDYKGDMAFTHTGITGPAILDFSRYIHPGDILKINLTGISAEEMEQRFIKQSQAGGTTLLSFLRNQSVVKNLAIALLENLQLSRDKPLSEVSAKHRRQLIQSCCAFPFEVNELAGFKKAMATAGGVSLNEINPLTMESRLVKNLYFTGEVLDIDGDTGGYNIQAAFSTAWLAAQNINMPGKLNL